MKLAEALSRRAELKKKAEDMQVRIRESCKVLEGDTPAEGCEELFGVLESTFDQLEEIIYRINKTNLNTICDGDSITRLIARKDVLSLRVSFMRSLVSYVADDSRYGKSDLRRVRYVDLAEIRKKSDDLLKQYRELDLKLQNLNWSTELL